MFKTRNNYITIAMLIAATVIISLALPRHDKITQLSYESGKPWLNPMLTAPFDIPIERDEADVQRITDSVSVNFMQIFRRDNQNATNQISALSKALSTHYEVPLSMRQGLVNAVAKAYNDGIVDNTTSDAITKGTLKRVRILDSNGVAQVVSTENMHSVRQVYETVDSVYGNGAIDLVEIISLSNYLSPNVAIDYDENDKLYNDALNSALAPVGTVQTGEAIIFTGNIVTPQKYTILQTYERMLAERAKENKSNTDLLIVGKIMTIALILAMFYVFLIAMRYRMVSDLRNIIFLISFITLFVVVVFLVVSFRYSFLYIIPFALVPIIITTFYDSRIAFFSHMVVVLISVLVAREQAQFIIMQFIAGNIAITLMQELVRRSQLVTCAFLIFVGYSLVFTAITLTRGGSLNSIDWHYIMYFAINCILLSFAYVGIFIVEKLFGFTSIVTLVELSDINSPVLRKLSERCPGTFQHAFQVANIASEAALKIGANQQLARAGALYHDIGKTENPAFFTENQNGVNPHDSLAPEQSAHIVIQHVTDGLRIAEKARLPQVIKDLIVQHHGSSITRYFYAQACKRNGGEPVDTAPYTYPGPKPQTKEAAILMMADACEAAAKSLSDHSEKAIATLVDRIIDGQIADGQLKEAPISFKDVEKIKGIFIERLKAFYYTRISYPDDIKPTVKHEEVATEEVGS